MRRCEKCGLIPTTTNEASRNFDTHHVHEQCTADECNRVASGRLLRDDLANLVILCKDCHQAIHRGEWKIIGWTTTSKGRELQWEVPVERSTQVWQKKREFTKEQDIFIRECLQQVECRGWDWLLRQLRWRFQIATTKRTILQTFCPN